MRTYRKKEFSPQNTKKKSDIDNDIMNEVSLFEKNRKTIHKSPLNPKPITNNNYQNLESMSTHQLLTYFKSIKDKA